MPQACTSTNKSSALQISLRKKNTTDNWWSLFKTKAIGEHPDTDEEDKNDDKKAAEYAAIDASKAAAGK